MQYGIVSATKVFGSGRWDPGFHLAVQKYEGQANEIKSQMMSTFNGETGTDAGKLAAKQCTDLLEKLPTEVLVDIAPLSKGQAADSRQALTKAFMEYPFLAMAIVKSSGKLEEFQAQKQKEASDTNDLVHQMSKLSSPVPQIKAPSRSPKP